MKNIPTFLLVEDDPEQQKAIIRNFADTGVDYKIYTASDALSALSKLNALKRKGKVHLPDVILLNLNLPGMSGIEFLAEVRNDPGLKPISVMVINGSRNPEQLKKAFYHNVSAYILKPTHPDELKSMVRKVTAFCNICEF